LRNLRLYGKICVDNQSPLELEGEHGVTMDVMYEGDGPEKI